MIVLCSNRTSDRSTTLVVTSVTPTISGPRQKQQLGIALCVSLHLPIIGYLGLQSPLLDKAPRTHRSELDQARLDGVSIGCVDRCRRQFLDSVDQHCSHLVAVDVLQQADDYLIALLVSQIPRPSAVDLSPDSAARSQPCQTPPVVSTYSPPKYNWLSANSSNDAFYFNITTLFVKPNSYRPAPHPSPNTPIDNGIMYNKGNYLVAPNHT